MDLGRYPRSAPELASLARDQRYGYAAALGARIASSNEQLHEIHSALTASKQHLASKPTPKSHPLWRSYPKQLQTVGHDLPYSNGHRKARVSNTGILNQKLMIVIVGLERLT